MWLRLGTNDGFGASTVTDNVFGTSVVTDDGFGASTVTDDDLGLQRLQTMGILTLSFPHYYLQ